MIFAVKSDGMTPKELAPCWKCLRCEHRWLIVNEKKTPKRCAKCKSILWNRNKMKMGPKPKDAKPGPRRNKLRGK